MARAGDHITIQLPVSQRPVVVRANIRNGEVFPADVEDDNGFVVDFDKQAFSVRKLLHRSNGNEFTFVRVECLVVVHSSSLIR